MNNKNFDAYLQRCQEQQNIPQEEIKSEGYISPGFNTMKEINAFAHTLKKFTVDSSKYIVESHEKI